jgi:hypothetical protein
MFKPMVRRIAAAVLVAPALVIATAAAASAAEHAVPFTPSTSNATPGSGWSGDDTLAWYHESGAAANAWGASTSRTDARIGSSDGDGDGYGYAWSNRTRASANAWGADAGRTHSRASYGRWGHGWGSSVGYSSSDAHAGADGASAGDIDAGAIFGH